MRKQTPDILSGLMGQSETGPVKQHAGIPEDPNAGMLDQKPAKATYYLSPDVIDSLALEQVRMSSAESTISGRDCLGIALGLE
jgi:hypothetical protein